MMLPLHEGSPAAAGGRTHWRYTQQYTQYIISRPDTAVRP
jgi:hypothetical protein